MKQQEKLAASELILNPDGSVYHLNLLPEDVAETIITVGDPQRVSDVTKHFDRIEIKKVKREFVTHTGYVGDKRITVISTGIGAGNIDIVMNELDALVNINLQTRQINESLKTLKIIRLGTSGSIHPDIQVDEVLISQFALGLDATIRFYGSVFGKSARLFQGEIQTNSDSQSISRELKPISHYYTACSERLNQTILPTAKRGITVTAPGFYAAQGRKLRGNIAHELSYDNWHKFSFETIPFTNLEMETACIYALANLLGHEALSVNCILANRLNGTFSNNPKASVEKMIVEFLNSI